MHPPKTKDSIRLVLSSADLVLRTIPVAKLQISIGRRPFNDISLDHLTVSGEHASLYTVGERRMLRDLKSRNGTRVNGQLISERLLEHGDDIEIGIYSLKFVIEQAPLALPPALRPTQHHDVAVLEYLSGPQIGQTIRLDRTLTSVTQGSNVISIARRAKGYLLTHLEGPAMPLVNGEPITLKPHPLVHFDLVEVGGATLRFRFNAQ
jgi:pSer/pThr/pTyr-binding forkhead associated (FHA) protein